METNLLQQLELVRLYKANDRKAQLTLYRQYCDGMFIVASRYLRDKDDAEDVLQEAFIKAFQRIEQYRGEVSFGAWLKRIVIHRCIDFLKAKKELFVELNENGVYLVDDDDWEVENDISAEQVKEEIERLPDKYKLVLQLYLLEGYDHSEISEILGISETNCRTRLLRGKNKLKDQLKSLTHGTGS